LVDVEYIIMDTLYTVNRKVKKTLIYLFIALIAALSFTAGWILKPNQVVLVTFNEEEIEE
jgi:hypothetical protein